LHGSSLSRRGFAASVGLAACLVPAVALGSADPALDGTVAGRGAWTAVELVAPDGRRTAIGALPSRAVLIHVWASWCARCLGELGPLEEAAARFERAGVSTLLVSHPKHWAADRAYLRQHGVNLPAYVLAPETSWELRAAALGMAGSSFAVPQTLLFAGRERRCVLVREGALDWRAPRVIAELSRRAAPAG
jgi:thiol-disulfide isomerase/thioredoxin